ncbi:MAG: hypothetical protein K8J08_10975 [Thermoanaerobaculia bacterium]|nr:hypothetical protein [Thermoanaerobaculia bacterium]
MLSCREIVHVVAADQLEGAGVWRRALVRLHLLMCRHCRGYTDQIHAIGQAARELAGRTAADDATEDRIRREILERSGIRERPESPPSPKTP